MVLLSIGRGTGLAVHSTDHLPAPISPIIGRERQIEQATNILVEQRVRLLTLTGPGGIGKTRLAYAVAQKLADWLPGGVAVVGLESVRDPSQLVVAIVRAVGVLDKSGDSESDLLRWLAEDERLLVLDNFEQVFGHVPIIGRLLAHCPGLRIIVTSRRAPLQLEGERVIEVGPLEFPKQFDDSIDPNDYPALQYFLQHAPSVDWETSCRSVVRICQRLEGIPLALELAGARVGLLSIDEIAEQATGWMPILTRGRPDAPERHRTMERTIDWSYRLLDADLQGVLRGLAVFTGGFSREGAVEVAGASPGQLTTLIESRLVAVSTSPERAPRFRLLEPVRDFAREAAKSQGEFEDLKTRHANWATRLVRSVSPTPFDPRIYTNEGTYLEQLVQTERANLLQALAWMIERKDTSRALIIASIMADFWYLRMQPGEGLSWLGATLDLPMQDPAVYGQEYLKVCLGYALLNQLAGNGDRAMTWAHHGLEVSQRKQDIVTIGEAYAVLGYVALNLGAFAESVDYSARALEIFRVPEFEDRPWQVDILENLALAELHRGNIERASSLVEEAVALGATMDASLGYATSLRALGDVRAHMGRFMEAVEAHEKAFAVGVLRHGRSSPETWHNVSQGMAGAATIAWHAFPDDPDFTVAIVESTERICRQLGTSKPDNRIGYQIIRDRLRESGLLAHPGTLENGPGPHLDTALEELRTTAREIRRRLPLGDPGATATVFPKRDELIAALSPVQLETIRSLVNGIPPKEIARRDVVRESSVYNRFDAIRTKWDLPPHASLVDLAVFAVRHGVA